jgi:hypothetical protein
LMLSSKGWGSINFIWISLLWLTLYLVIPIYDRCWKPFHTSVIMDDSFGILQIRPE